MGFNSGFKGLNLKKKSRRLFDRHCSDGTSAYLTARLPAETARNMLLCVVYN